MISQPKSDDVAFVSLYFNRGGLFGSHFPLWLESCGRNPGVTWLLYTDCSTNLPVPPNVRIVRSSLEECHERFQALLPFECSLGFPYKLCDYKVAYGEAFANELEPYGWWGFCDMDLIWGNLEELLFGPESIECERVFLRGHCSVFENDELNRTAWRSMDPMGCQRWQDVYATNRSCSFDEIAEHAGGGMSLVYSRNGVPMDDRHVFADVVPHEFSFELNPGRFEQFPEERGLTHRIFARVGGRLYGLGISPESLVVRSEFAYAHFQKRPIVLEADPWTGDYLVLPPNRVVPAPEGFSLNDVSADDLRGWCPRPTLAWKARAEADIWGERLKRLLVCD